MEALTKMQLSVRVDLRLSLGASGVPQARSSISPATPSSGRPVSLAAMLGAETCTTSILRSTATSTVSRSASQSVVCRIDYLVI